MGNDTGATVRRNLARLRTQQGLSVRALSERLDSVGHRLLPSAITKTELGTRRVDVDDLTALAVALGVSPSALLMPDVEAADCPVRLTGLNATPATDCWAWLSSSKPVGAPHNRRAIAAFRLRTIPAWGFDDAR